MFEPGMAGTPTLRTAGWLMLAVVLTGCYPLVYRGQDEKNLRRQLHVPSEVRVISLDGFPKSAGFFGREGLRIHAIFEFEADQLDQYVAAINDPESWRPAPLVAYSPREAEEYSAASMRWNDLPVPSWTETRLRDWSSLPAIQRIERGRVYCSSIAIVQDDPGAWRYVGRSCEEVARLGSSSIVTILGVLDLDTRRLHAHISFSG